MARFGVAFCALGIGVDAESSDASVLGMSVDAESIDASVRGIHVDAVPLRVRPRDHLRVLLGVEVLPDTKDRGTRRRNR